MIRSATPLDSDQTSEIYNYCIFNSIVTFEETLISLLVMSERICSITDEGDSKACFGR